MKTFLAAALAGAVSASEHQFRFMQYVSKFNKNYASVEEFETRMANWIEKEIDILNHEMDTEATYTLAHNHMSDWSQEEYRQLLTYRSDPEMPKYYNHEESNATANSVDWVSAGAVTPVKDQGQCGSCWSFSATGAMEGVYQIANGTLESFSEEQLVECDTSCYACNGGWQYKAFNYYKTSNVILESNYSYTSGTGHVGSCEYSSKTHTNINTSGYTNVTADNVTDMKNALAGRPLSVSIEADRSCFQLYSGGILNSKACGTNLDHAVLVVGWNTDSSGNEYWIVKNSWGTGWGDKGYINLAIVSGQGICGVQMEPLYPNLA